MTSSKERVAILGGGVGALCAAVALTEIDPKGEKYEITLYQLGWRLGGKCASGRNLDLGGRIQEHGLHIWAGFYDNAFTVMRIVCNALGWKLDDLFERQNLIFYSDKVQDGPSEQWQLWPFWFQPSQEPLKFPGRDSLWAADPLMPSLGTEIRRAIDGIIVAVEAWLNQWPGQPEYETSAAIAGLSAALQGRLAAWGIPPATKQSPHPLLELARRCAVRLVDDVADVRRTAAADVASLLDAYHDLLKGHFGSGAHLPREARIGLTIITLGISIVSGMLKHGCLEKGLQAIDDLEFRDFLAEQNPAAADNEIVIALYEYIFAYKDGSRSQPSVSACSAVQGLMRLFLTYKDAFFFKGLRGMGDIICTPIYKLLKQRGVTFKFFHKVTELQPTPDGRDIGTILVDEQVAMLNGSEYQPLVPVQSFDCWPSTPSWDQLENGEAYKAEGVNFESAYGPVPQPPPANRLQLKLGQDFDRVILGISVGALAQICAPLVRQKPAWAAMVEKLATVRTQALQLWVDSPVKELNSTFLPPKTMSLPAPEKVGPIVTTCEPPFDTYSDMSQLLPAEDWPSPGPGSVAYFCSVLDESAPNDEAAAAKVVKDNAQGWMTSWLHNLWPGIGQGADFDWSLLHAPADVSGPLRLDAQYWRANIDPTERYVLSLPGTLKHRMEPGNSGYANLFLAGDWTRVPEINAGCVEVAAMSGLGAAAALSGVPIPIVSGTPLPQPTNDYIDYGGWLTVPPAPATCNDTTFYSFPFPADRSACQSFLDRSYNRAAGYTRFRAMLDLVFLNIVQSGKLGTPTPPFASEGTMPEADIGFWVLAGDYAPGAVLPRSIGWVPAYLFVDNAWSTMAGREVWGLPKYFASLTLPTPGSPATGPFAVSALGIKTFGPSAQAREHQLLKLTGTGLVISPLRDTSDATTPMSPVDLFRRLCEAGDDALLKQVLDGPAAPPFLGAANAGLPVFYLKQFRSADSPDAASYQALLQGPFQLTKLHDAGLLLGAWTLELSEVDSLPFIADLGLGTPTDGKLDLTANIGVWAQVDFEIGPANPMT